MASGGRGKEAARHRPAGAAVALRATTVDEQLATTRDGIGRRCLACFDRGDRLHEVVDVGPVRVLAHRCGGELAERLAERADAGERDLRLFVELVAVGFGRRVGDRTETARHVARVALEVGVLVVERGPVEHALLCGPGPCEKLPSCDALARSRAEIFTSRCPRSRRAARATRRPTFAAGGAVGSRRGPPTAPREVEALAALDARFFRVRGSRRRLRTCSSATASRARPHRGGG